MRTPAEQAAVEVENMFAVVVCTDRGTELAALIREQAAEIERLKRVNFELANAESKEHRVAMLLADAARLDWLESALRKGWLFGVLAFGVAEGKPIREAIDAAMQPKKE